MGNFTLATTAEKSFLFYDNVLDLKGVLLFLLLLFVSWDRFTSTWGWSWIWCIVEDDLELQSTSITAVVPNSLGG